MTTTVEVHGNPETPYELKFLRAVMDGDLSAVQEMIDSECHDIRSSYTPLEVAIISGQVDIVKALLQADVDVNTNGSQGTPLHYAAMYLDDASVVEAMIEAGAEIEAEWEDEGGTALHTACMHGNNKIIKLLIENGADVNVKDHINGETPLHIASREKSQNDTEVIAALLDAGADIEATTAYCGGLTPLFLAAKYGNSTIVKDLIEAGADMSRETEPGVTPLSVAKENGHSEVVSILLEVSKTTSNKM